MDILDKIEDGRIRGFRCVRKKIIYANAIYHITQRAPGKEKLFLEDSDYLHMLSLTKEIAKDFSWRIFCFALLTNHLHFLLQITEENLSKGAKKLFERYAKYLNAKYQRKGPVFCKPYRASLCFDESYVLASSIYIHLNPFKAGLVENPIDYYRWSSLKLFIDANSPVSFIDYQFVLRLLEDDINKAKNIYKKLLLQAAKVEYKTIWEDSGFMNKFKSFIFNYLASSTIKEKSHKVWSLDKEIREFQSKRRLRSPEALSAKKYLFEQLLANGYRISEISSLLCVSRQAIYNILNLTK